MKTISASAIKIRWTAVTVSLAGHALAAAAVGPDTALPPRDSPPITVELVLLDEPGSSPEIPAGPSPPDIARDLAPVPVGTAAPAAPGARTLRVGVREETPRAAPAARTPKPRRNAPLPRIKPPTPQAVPDGATAVGLPDREDMSAVDAPPWGPADTGWNRPSAVSRSAADTPRRDRPDASLRRVASIRVHPAARRNTDGSHPRRPGRRAKSSAGIPFRGPAVGAGRPSPVAGRGGSRGRGGTRDGHEEQRPRASRRKPRAPGGERMAVSAGDGRRRGGLRGRGRSRVLPPPLAGAAVPPVEEVDHAGGVEPPPLPGRRTSGNTTRASSTTGNDAPIRVASSRQMPRSLYRRPTAPPAPKSRRSIGRARVSALPGRGRSVRDRLYDLVPVETRPLRERQTLGQGRDDSGRAYLIDHLRQLSGADGTHVEDATPHTSSEGAPRARTPRHRRPP